LRGLIKKILREDRDVEDWDVSATSSHAA